MMRQGRIYDRGFAWRFILFLMVSIAVLLSLTIKANAETFTFGGDTTGTSYWAGGADSMVLLYPTTSPATALTLDSAVGFFASNWKGPHTVSIILFNSDSTALDSTLTFVVSNSARTRYAAAFKNHAAVTAGTAYLYGVHYASAGGTPGTMRIYEVGGASSGSWRMDTGRAVIPATFITDITVPGYLLSISLFGTGEGEEPPPPFIGTGRRRMICGGDD